MDLLTINDIIRTVAIMVGVTLGLIELRQSRIARKRESMFSLVRAYQIPELWIALEKIFHMPDGLSKKRVEACFGKDIHLLSLLISTYESLGILVQKREIDIEIVEDFFSGPIVISWRKLKRATEDSRKQQGRETLDEWFQWLAERIIEREKRRSPMPAHLEFKN
jgi:hypothetical protein